MRTLCKSTAPPGPAVHSPVTPATMIGDRCSTACVEHGSCELGAGQLEGGEHIPERQRLEQFALRDRTGGDVAPDAMDVHEADIGLHGLALHLGDIAPDGVRALLAAPSRPSASRSLHRTRGRSRSAANPRMHPAGSADASVAAQSGSSFPLIFTILCCVHEQVHDAEILGVRSGLHDGNAVHDLRGLQPRVGMSADDEIDPVHRGGQRGIVIHALMRQRNHEIRLRIELVRVALDGFHRRQHPRTRSGSSGARDCRAPAR